MSRLYFFDSFDKSRRPKSRVELHLHLDGCFRISTIWDLARKKEMDLGYETLEDLKEALVIKRPGTLADFLEPFSIFMPVFAGDGEAIERAAYELCEDQAKQGVLYFEARYSPQGLSNVRGPTPESETVDPVSPDAFTPEQVVQAVNAGLKRGEEDFGVKARSILCCIIGAPHWNNEVLDLCHKFRNEGVVGIDISGSTPSLEHLGKLYPDEVVKIFQKASSLGVRRTAHAGEVGSSALVDLAIHQMHAERIGHGYHVLEDMLLYEEVLRNKIHLETCPKSSLLTGSVPLSEAKHPVVKFCEDGANFSVSKDCTTPIGSTLDDEYDMLRNMGLDHSHFCRANFNAARSCFLPEQEKQVLIEQLQEIYKCK